MPLSCGFIISRNSRRRACMKDVHGTFNSLLSAVSRAPCFFSTDWSRADSRRISGLQRRVFILAVPEMSGGRRRKCTRPISNTVPVIYGMTGIYSRWRRNLESKPPKCSELHNMSPQLQVPLFHLMFSFPRLPSLFL